MSLSVDFDSEFQRNRAAIQLWLEQLAQAKYASESLDNEAAAWYWGLPQDQRSRLESDLARLTFDHKEIETIARGPLGELIGRFSGLIPSNPSKLPDQKGRSEEDESAPSEIEEIVAELGKLGEIDPSWSADWKAFQESVEAPELPDDRGADPDA